MQIQHSIFNYTIDLTAPSIGATLRPWSMLMEFCAIGSSANLIARTGTGYFHLIELFNLRSQPKGTPINETVKLGAQDRRARFI